MSETYELTREITIAASPEIVFGFLTEEAKMKKWFGEVVEADSRPGGVFHFGERDPNGNHCRGEFVEIVPNEKVVFTWGGIEDLPPGDSTVEIILKSQGKAMHLTLRHYNIRLKPSADSLGIQSMFALQGCCVLAHAMNDPKIIEWGMGRLKSWIKEL